MPAVKQSFHYSVLAVRDSAQLDRELNTVQNDCPRLDARLTPMFNGTSVKLQRQSRNMQNFIQNCVSATEYMPDKLNISTWQSKAHVTRQCRLQLYYAATEKTLTRIAKITSEIQHATIIVHL